MAVTIFCKAWSPRMDQRRIQAGLGAVADGIKSAERGAVAAAVLVVALVGDDVGKIRHLAGAEVAPQSTHAVEGDTSAQ